MDLRPYVEQFRAWLQALPLDRNWVLAFVVVASAILLIWILLIIVQASRRIQWSWFRVLVPTHVLSLFDARRLLRPLLTTLQQLGTGKEWRYRTPWYLMLGSAGAGKSTLLTHLDLEQPQAHLLTKLNHLKARGVKGWFFSKGVVLDVEGQYFDAEEESDADQWWHQLLDVFFSFRSERPMDGILLTVSAETLQSLPPDRLDDLGERFYQRLWQIQKHYAFVLPVYLIVTQCDRLDDFDAFWQAFAPERFDEMWGWSSPYSLDVPFVPEWVDEAFDYTTQQLRKSQIQVASGGAEIDAPDAFFLFPQRFRRLHTPLKRFLHKAFPETTYHESFVFRGMFFSGHLETEPAESNTISDSAWRSPKFLKQLFTQKIFAEPNIARPTFQRVISRNRYVRNLQITMLVAFTLLFGWGIVDSLGLHNQVQSVQQSLNQMARYRHQQEEQNKVRTALREQGDVPFETAPSPFIPALLREMTSMNAEPLGRLAMPYSWFVDLDGELVNYLTTDVFEEGILNTIDDDLVNRLNRIIRHANATPVSSASPVDRLTTDLKQATQESETSQHQEVLDEVVSDLSGAVDSALHTPEFHAVSHYFQQILNFETNRKRYLRIANHDDEDADLDKLKHLSHLINYLYDVDLDGKFANQNTLYRAALHNALYQPCPPFAVVPSSDCTPHNAPLYLGPSAYESKVESPLSLLGQRLYARIMKEPPQFGQLPEKLSILTESQEMVLSSDLRAEVQQDINRFRDWVNAPEQQWITESQTKFDSRATPRTPCGEVFGPLALQWGRLQTEYDYPRNLQDMLAAFSISFQDEDCRNVARQQLQQLQGSGVEQLVTLDKSELVIDSGADALMQTLQFMSRMEFPVFTAPAPQVSDLDPVLWDVENLQLAVRTLRNFQTFSGSMLPRIPEQWRETVKQKMRNRWQTSLAQILARTRQPLLSPGDPESLLQPLSVFEAQLATQVSNLREVMPTLLQLRTLLGQEKFETLYTQFTQTSRNNALRLLQQLTDLAESNGLYRAPAQFYWKGKDFAGILFNLSGKGQIQKYLATQRERMSLLSSQYAAAPVSYLINTQPVGHQGQNDQEAWALWHATLIELDKYQKKDPTSELTHLETFFQKTLSSIAPAQCLPAWQKVSSKAVGADWFSQASVLLHEEGLLACYALQEQKTRQRYQQISQAFNQQLAGQFPFSDQPQERAEVPLQTATVFFANYQKNATNLVEELQELAQQNPQYRAPQAFIRDLDVVSHFLSQTGLLTTGKPPAVGIKAKFRVLPKRSLGLNQILFWELVSEGNLLMYPNTESTPFSWEYGAPISFALTWKKDAAILPEVQQGGQYPQVNQSKVTFSRQGNWALFRLVREFQMSGDAQRYRFPTSRILGFTVPVRQNKTLFGNSGAGDSRASGNSGASGNSKASGNSETSRVVIPSEVNPAEVFVRIWFQGKDAKTQKNVLLTFPNTFPHYAPELEFTDGDLLQ